MRRRYLWAFVLAMVLIVSVAAWLTRDSRTPLGKDCSVVTDLGRRSHDLTMWLRSGLDDGSLRDPDEIVRRESALSDELRDAANSVTTPEMKNPLNTWADAAELNAQLQREANSMPAGTYPSREWVNGTYKYNAMTDEAVGELDQWCPGLKEIEKT